MSSQESLFITVVGSLLAAVSMAAFAVASLRGRSREPALARFGLFVLLYAVRLLGRSPLVREATGIDAAVLGAVGGWITCAIIVPAAMFVEAISAPRLRPVLRLVWQADVVYVALAVAAAVTTGDRGWATRFNAEAVFGNFAVFAGCLVADLATRRQGPPRPRAPVRPGTIAAVAGTAVFALMAGYETLMQRSPVASITSLEPLGMLALVIGLGYFVAERVIDREERWLALAHELQTARQIQQSILPKGLPSAPGLAIAARYLPMTEVAGDFYDFLEPGDGRVGILVADVSGHGVPAALIASMVKVALAAQADRAADPARVLAGMNQVLCGRIGVAFVTATYVFVDPSRGRVAYAAAGHPPILRVPAGGGLERLDERGLVLGFDAAAAYTNAAARLDPGDRLLLYTDGLTEAADSADVFFGDARLTESLRDAASLPVGAFIDRLVDDMEAWRGRRLPQGDDVTLVAIEGLAIER
jgi:phosphoserine phosphatase RsbU/P